MGKYNGTWMEHKEEVSDKIQNINADGDTFTGEVYAVGTVETAEHAAGAVGTGGSVETYRYNLPNGDICTEIQVDITGLGCKGDAQGDVIGVVTDTPVAYIGRYVTATCGIVYKVEMICLEAPGQGTATITADIDLMADNEATLDYDAAADDTVIARGGSWAAGNVVQNLVPALTANDYLYLGEGDTAASTGVYNAGQFIIRLYGHAAL